MDSTLNLSKLAKHFSDESAARELLEAMRWPNGAECPMCGHKTKLPETFKGTVFLLAPCCYSRYGFRHSGASNSGAK